MIAIGPYDYDNLLRSFLAQDRPSAKTADKRLSYSGFNLFSYNSKLAVLATYLPFTLYIDKSIAAYSNTTRRQTYKLLRIVAEQNWTVFTVDLHLSSENNLSAFWEDIELLITRYKRARTTKPSIKQSIYEAVSKAQHFAEWHELDPTIPDILMRHLFINQLLK